ncbi:hypothetical protein HZF24_15360 [Sedimentibacter hydroxybenzoicus DSM 7310]|uniref:Uncharacterized protein n=1 Tax=Sedimentibacter hydroxybenzoicus DSM 7310 TaxID=1123245 RepID=A0A974BLF4_SEDHY|nr:hypothetical protein [Sedimentibacter hydroxybenzoicus]NYB75525.1 hypothetical protein [Sedimentibacter hydroxybenzoicus DSM 7310]
MGKNKISLKKLIIMIMIFALGLSSSVYASIPNKLPEDHKVINGQLYINGNKVTEIIQVESGITKELTIDQYILELEYGEISFDDTITLEDTSEDLGNSPLGITDDWYRYDETSNITVLRTDKRERVSTVLKNETSNPADHILSTTCVSGHSFSFNVGTGERPYIQTGAGFTWESSLSRTEEKKLTINSGMYGWWEFAPQENKTVGLFKTFSWLGELKDFKQVHAYSPKKVNNKFLDGVYYALESSKMPTN